ncbi:hypothetical protein [Helicobacter saguini]|uniref:Permuted papain-like amidase YaeF/Yiix C92 family enzyme n=2 Tax=Helicobacter saguini TaxID=1548018 RepID=A0A347VSV4_9HELI|nr:hypothetical protein [Helicobacter saguini]MWV62350.1 hypothetical protein [Helicobacter saguini]MWV69327.1 hypothetical protein [Helicobacter saguini]MWV71118.1 hypothetical protein [Helicobacter saguini]TLD94988.1 hypothetical protein LS64_003450 [Helicobacter saguini]
MKICLLLCFICSSLNDCALKSIAAFKVGDIILREGSDLDSLLIKQVIKDKYTHIGLIISINPLQILHATTNDNQAKQNQVIISSFNEYISHAKSVAVRRLNLSQNARENIALDSKKWVGKAFVLESRTFDFSNGDLDSKFKSLDSKSDVNALYCTTLLESILRKYTNITFKYTYVDFPLFRGYYLLPKAFMEHSREIFSLDIAR